MKKIKFLEQDIFVVEKNKNQFFLNEKDYLVFEKNPEKIFCNSENRAFFFVDKNYINYLETTNVWPEHRQFIQSTLKNQQEQKNEILIECRQNSLGYTYYVSQEGQTLVPYLFFDHIRGNINDVDFEIDNYVEYLSKRDDIVFISGYNGYLSELKILPTPLNDQDPAVGKIIYDIHHHLEEGETCPEEKESFAFYYKLSPEAKKAFIEFNTQELRQQERKYEIYSFEKKMLFDFLSAKDFYILSPESEEKIRKFKR